MRRLAASTVAMLVGMAPLAGAGDVIDRLSRIVPFSAGASIRVDATIGDVRIAAADRADVQIEIERRAPARADFARFVPRVDASADGVHVSVVQEGDGRDPRLNATIAITAPASAVFSAVRVFEGHVRIANVRSSADVDIRRGTIEATRMAGRVRLESGIGGIDVRESELTDGGMMRLRVFNGPLYVRFGQRPSNARILAVTLNGAIKSDIPLSLKDMFGPRFGETTIGSGEPVLSMDVVKGDINLTVAGR